MDYLSNEEGYLRASTYLNSVAGKFGLTREQMTRMKPTPSELYVNSVLSAGGTAHLLTGNSTQETGVTNFDGNRLEQGRYFVINAVTILYGEAAADKKVWEVDYTKKLPAELLSSHLVVRQNGETIVKLPISSINNAKQSDAFYRQLEALAVIEPTQTVELMIETPQGSSITPTNSSDKSFVRVLLKGFETYLKR